jgi:hypothetical protein
MAAMRAMRSAGLQRLSLQFRMRICSCFAMSGSALCRLVRTRACAEASAQMARTKMTARITRREMVRCISILFVLVSAPF